VGAVVALTSINFPPGIQKDGTQLDTDCCIDGQWVRFRNKRPRKILGYQGASDGLLGIGRRIHMFYKNNKVYVHVGTGKGLQQFVMTPTGTVLSSADRTPLSFPSGPDAGWSLDALFDSTSDVTQIVAHSSPEISVTASDDKTIPYIGDITSTDRLIPLANPFKDDGYYYNPKVSGGIVCVQPFLFDFDSDGYIGWSAPNLPNTLGIQGGTSGAGNARVSAQKIVAGQALRGGGANSPAALFWSLSELILAQFIGTANGGFRFTTVSPSTSILSAQSIIEDKGLYFWAGVDSFMCYNGTVVEIPNSYNADFFFDNMNWDAAGKAFACKIPRFAEIWFCAPLFGASEPNYAVIYNLREQCWYHTALPEGGRGAAYFPQGLRYPIMTGVENVGGSGDAERYSLWVHEKGTDKVTATGPVPIRSYYDTPIVGGPGLDPPDDHGTAVQTIEPDFIQSGDMTATVMGTFNSKANDMPGKPSTIKAIPETPAQQIVGFSETRRLARLRFESNTLGGNYVAGKTILHSEQGDCHLTGGPNSAIPPKGSP
jgi:hypothetical protein